MFKILKGSLDKGIATVSIKSSEVLEISKFKTQIATFTNEINERKNDIGAIVYKMYISGNYDFELLNNICAEIKDKESSIATIYEKIAQLQFDNNRVFGKQQISRCNKCNESNPTNAKFCIACGNALLIDSENKFCSCGTQNTLKAKFCIKCGKALV